MHGQAVRSDLTGIPGRDVCLRPRGWCLAEGRLVRSAILLLLTLFLSGCVLFGSGEQDGVQPVSIVPVRPTSEIEAAIGARENPRVIAEYGGVYSDPDVERVLTKMVERLIAASDEPSRTYRITILNSPVANAFALPGGYLYVTRGLLALAGDSSEVAAVLAHEIAHVLANHALERAQVVEQATLVERVAADVLSDPTAGQTAIANSQLTLASFSRSQEIEADRIGIAIAARAGYDPFAAARFIDKLRAYAEFRSAIGDDDATSFLASHPTAPERQQLALREARRFGAPGIGETGRDPYLKSLDGMIFGDDPSEGYVRGREFLHARLAIGFEVPPGYRLENTREAVLAAAGRDRAMRFDAVAAGNTTPGTYLESGWVNGLVPGSVEELRINGLPAAVAKAEARNWAFRIAAIQVGDRMYRFIFAGRSAGQDIQNAMTQTIQTFRKLSPIEVARLRPLRIDVVRVRQGDTTAKLAARINGVDRKVELFRLLNGLAPGQDPVPGSQAKVVKD